MDRVFSTWLRSLASLFSATVLAVTWFGVFNAEAMIVKSANSDNQPAFNAVAITDLLGDWDRDLMFYAELDVENADRPALPYLSPDEPQASEAAASGDEALGNDTSLESEAMTVDGHGAMVEETAPDNDATSTAEATEPAGLESEAMTVDGHGAMVEDTTPDNDATSTAEATEPAGLDSEAMTVDGHGAMVEDTTPDNDGTPTAEATEAASSTSDSSVDDWDYDRYRHELIDNPSEDNEIAGLSNVAPTSNSDSAEIRDGAENRMDAEDSDNEVADTSDRSERGSMEDALLAVVSLWADDLASGYGLKASQVMGLLGRIRCSLSH